MSWKWTEHPHGIHRGELERYRIEIGDREECWRAFVEIHLRNTHVSASFRLDRAWSLERAKSMMENYVSGQELFISEVEES